ncbi:uncharacterized protein [Odocoileus virginianus]|uniref:Uncharacterized protein n=1 Tax=Odocoileus virginianus TaxID=9874 RepID=A0ABM4IJY0_ODOVR
MACGGGVVCVGCAPGPRLAAGDNPKGSHLGTHNGNTWVSSFQWTDFREQVPPGNFRFLLHLLGTRLQRGLLPRPAYFLLPAPPLAPPPHCRPLLPSSDPSSPPQTPPPNPPSGPAPHLPLPVPFNCWIVGAALPPAAGRGRGSSVDFHGVPWAGTGAERGGRVDARTPGRERAGGCDAALGRARRGGRGRISADVGRRGPAAVPVGLVVPPPRVRKQ